VAKHSESSSESPTTELKSDRKRIVKSPMELFGKQREIKPMWPNSLFIGLEGMQAAGRHLFFECFIHVGSAKDEGDFVFGSAGAQQLYERVWAQFKLQYFYFPVFIKTSEEVIDGEMCDVGYHQYFCAYIPVPWGWGVGNDGVYQKEAFKKWVSDLLEVEGIRDLPPSDNGTRWVPMSEGVEPSVNFWSDPVQVKLIDGELVFRSCKQIAGIEDSGYDAWAPEDGLSA
jgi:hypothetical protein